MKEIYGIISGMEEIYKKTVNENGICSCNDEELNMTNPKDFRGENMINVEFLFGNETPNN